MGNCNIKIIGGVRMFTVKESEYKTPIGAVNRAELLMDGAPFLAYECTKGSSNAILGLVSTLNAFEREAIESINKHLKETT